MKKIGGADLSWWVVGLVIFFAWFMPILVSAAALSVKHALERDPDKEAGGVSVLPVFPLIPMIVYGVWWCSNAWIASMIFWFHVAVSVLSVVAFGFYTIRLCIIQRTHCDNESVP